jgi:DNA-binding response OmpR family regulator
MKGKFTILIADRSRNILEFLQREMSAEGYLVQVANNGPNVLKIINLEHPDLLILDLDIPYLNGLEILEKLENEKQSIPVIVHSFLDGVENNLVIQKIAAFIEKNGKNVTNLKALIAEVLRKYYPHRFNRIYRRARIK